MGPERRADKLESWKEIATYLNRGVRTVQRWEQEEELPVRRLHHDKLGSVYAFRQELDAWLVARGGKLRAAGQESQPRHRAIAVLPFADLSRERDQEYFCDGMAEEIITRLSRLSQIRVASRASSFRFRGAVDTREAGKKLGVSALVEGSIRKSGDLLRVSVQLTGAENGYQIWSQTFDKQMGDVFAIQAEIAAEVVNALEIGMPDGSTKLPSIAPPTRNIEAYDCYLRGRKFYYQYGPRDMDFAIQLFSRAVELDPAYPLAYAGLADCWSYIYLYSTRDEAVREQAEWASQRAVELDAQCAQAQASWGLALSLRSEFEEAEAAFLKAIDLDRNLYEAYYFYARQSFARGQAEKAVELYQEAIRVRPEEFQARLLMAQSYEDLGQPEQARLSRQKGIEMAGQHLLVHPDDVRAMYMAANGMAALGQQDQARQLAERALALRPDDAMLLYNVGCIFSMLGDPKKALDALEKAAAGGLRQRGWYEHDNNLDPLREEPRFKKLLKSL
jgi:TolB-like protein/Tfp pilus assembly protein PilF